MKFVEFCILLIFLKLFLYSSDMFGQDSLATETSKLDFLNHIDDRKWSVKVPIWIPGFRGDFAYGGITLLPEEEDHDIVERLEGELGVTFYLIGDIRFKTNKWMFAVNGFSTTLASNLKFQNIDKVEFLAAIDGTILRGLAGYQVFKKHNPETYFNVEIHPYAGIRYIDLKIYSEDSDILDVNPDWFEPLVGLNVNLSHKRWFFNGIVDVGGFGIDDHWSAFANLGVDYRFSKLFGIGMGWMHLSFNYDQSFDFKDLYLNIALSGPVVNVVFHF